MVYSIQVDAPQISQQAICNAFPDREYDSEKGKGERGVCYIGLRWLEWDVRFPVPSAWKKVMLVEVERWDLR